MPDAVVSKLIAASRGSPCDSMASCFTVLVNSQRLCTWSAKETRDLSATTLSFLGRNDL